MITKMDDISSETQRKINFIDSLYLYSDLSVEHMAKTVGMNVKEVQQIIDNLIKKDALKALYEQANMPIKQIMKKNITNLDYSKTAFDAASLMIEKGTGYVVITAQDKPFGMVTERDILCEMTFCNMPPAEISLKVIASRPLIYASPEETVENVADLMMKNSIRRIPIIEDNKLAGIVVARDLAMLVSSTKRPGLSKTILEAISRSRDQ